MVYEKRVLVLKQTESGYSLTNKPLSAICRIEKEYGVCSLHLTTLNCAYTDGEYFLFVIDSALNTHAFNLGKTARASGLYFEKEPKINKGIGVGLCSVKNDIPLTIAYAREDCLNYTKEQFKKAIAEYFIERRKTKSRKVRETTPSSHQPCEEPQAPSLTKPVYPPPETPDPSVTPPQEFPSPKDKFVKTQYDDEAVATENYYKNDSFFEQTLKTFEDIDCGNIQFENDLPFDTGKAETAKDCQSCYGVQNETNFDKRKANKADSPHYYQTVKKELDALFDKFPTEDALGKIFCESKFVKINYSADKFYVVGLIKEEFVEKYICYGVPGKYSPDPPKELKGYCTFIPLSIFNVCGDGYWMIFQDALTGKCITPITA